MNSTFLERIGPAVLGCDEAWSISCIGLALRDVFVRLKLIMKIGCKNHSSMALSFSIVRDLWK